MAEEPVAAKCRVGAAALAPGTAAIAAVTIRAIKSKFLLLMPNLPFEVRNAVTGNFSATVLQRKSNCRPSG
jgi:hypothetical protein